MSKKKTKQAATGAAKKNSKKKKQNANFDRMIEISLSNEIAALESFMRSMHLINDDEYIYGRVLDTVGQEPTKIYIKKEVSN